MANGLLGQIANPAFADVAGAVALGQQNRLLQQQRELQLQQAEQQRQAQQLAGEILGERVGSKLADLSNLDPEQMLAVSQAVGIPVDQEGRIRHFFGGAQKALITAEVAGPQAALDDLVREKQFLNGFGIDSPRVDRLIGTFQQNPALGIDQLKQFVDAGVDAGILKSQKATEKRNIPRQKTGSFLVRNPETGQTELVTGAFNPQTGQLEAARADIGGELVSRLGETGIEESQRRVQETKRKKQQEGVEARASDLIARGVEAAEGTAQVRRGLDLLETVSTGGPQAISLSVKQRLGIEGADEGELSGALGKAVLSQLRETFGAAFTEAEGERLVRIEANFGKSNAANKRLLQQTLRIMERTAKRARKTAKERGDEETVADIDDLLTFSLTPEGDTQQQERDQSQIIEINF